jgi:hypothetical protein
MVINKSSSLRSGGDYLISYRVVLAKKGPVGGNKSGVVESRNRILEAMRLGEKSQQVIITGWNHLNLIDVQFRRARQSFII